MKKSDIYEIALKIIGIYLFVNIVPQIFEFVVYLFGAFKYIFQSNYSVEEQITSIVIGAFGLLITVIISWLLIFKTKFVAAKICSQSDFEENAKLFLKARVVYEVAIIIIGLILIAWTLPDFAFRFVSYVKQIKHGEQARNGDYNYILNAALKIILGVFSILLAKQSQNILQKKNVTRINLSYKKESPFLLQPI